MIQEIELTHLQTIEELSPRGKVDAKHVQDFVDMAGEWRPILVRPIIHKWYRWQLIDGFHRFEAAERLGMVSIPADVEEMDDATAYARALKENLHGLPITPDDRKARVVMLRRQFKWTQEQIASGTGVTKAQVSKYLAADRVEEELVSSRNNSDDSPPRLSIEQTAALAKLVPPDPDAQPAGRKTSEPEPPRLITTPVVPKPDPKAAQREAARPVVPVIAKAAAEHKLPPATVSALADAALAAPTHAPALVEKVITEKLAPDAVRHAANVLANPETPPELAEEIVQLGSLIRDASGHMPASEIARGVNIATAQSPHTLSVVFLRYISALRGYTDVNEDHIQAWLDTASVADMESCARAFEGVERFIAHVRELQQPATGLRLVK